MPSPSNSLTEEEHYPQRNNRRGQRGRPYSMPLEITLRELLNFTTLEHRRRYEEIQHHLILVCKYIFLFTLDTLNMCDNVFNYFDAIG